MNSRFDLYGIQLRLRQKFIARTLRTRAAPPKIDPATYKPERVLFVLAGLIGDSVMSLPAINEARRIWPEARITVLGKKHNRELIAACPFFDEFYECSADPFSFRKSREIDKLETWLSEQNFDTAFILLGDQFAHLLARAKIPVRVGVKGTPLENCLTHTYDIGSRRTWGSDEMLNAVRCLGYSVEPTLPRLFIDDTARQRVKEKLIGWGLDESKDYAVLHPFGSSRRQWWGIDKVGPLAARMDEELGLRTVLVGGSETVSQIPTDASVIDATGRLSMPELLAMIDGAKLVVTTDSGPFHIAGALGKRIVGIFRSRRPEHAKRYPDTTVVFGENDRCVQVCAWEQCESEPCRQMQDISADSVELR